LYGGSVKTKSAFSHSIKIDIVSGSKLFQQTRVCSHSLNISQTLTIISSFSGSGGTSSSQNELIELVFAKSQSSVFISIH